LSLPTRNDPPMVFKHLFVSYPFLFNTQGFPYTIFEVSTGASRSEPCLAITPAFTRSLLLRRPKRAPPLPFQNVFSVLMHSLLDFFFGISLLPSTFRFCPYKTFASKGPFIVRARCPCGILRSMCSSASISLFARNCPTYIPLAFNLGQFRLLSILSVPLPSC